METLKNHATSTEIIRNLEIELNDLKTEKMKNIYTKDFNNELINETEETLSAVRFFRFDKIGFGPDDYKLLKKKYKHNYCLPAIKKIYKNLKENDELINASINTFNSDFDAKKYDEFLGEKIKIIDEKIRVVEKELNDIKSSLSDAVSASEVAVDGMN